MREYELLDVTLSDEVILRFSLTHLSGDDLGSRDVTDVRQSNEISKGGHPVRTYKDIFQIYPYFF